MPTIVEFFKPILVNQTVDDIQTLWQRMFLCGNYWCRVGLGLAVINGIEAALWDLRGKILKQPVHQLLGGARHSSLPCYATGGPSNYPKDQLAAKMDFYLGLGFLAFKLGAGAHDIEKGWTAPSDGQAIVDFETDKLTFVRRHVGPDILVMLDGHMGNIPSGIGEWSLETAIAVIKALDSFNLFFFEEPLPYSNPAAYAHLCEQVNTPIAGGEPLTGIYEWRAFAERNSFDVGQPDASFIGGLSEFIKVAKMFDDMGRSVATHAWGAGGALMQNVHCGFAANNTIILEVPPAYGPLHREIIGDSFIMRHGRVYPPDAPGLGIRLTDKIKSQFPFVPGSGEYLSVPGKVLPEEQEIG